MATLAIGDIHGNLSALNDLLAVIDDEAGRGDTVVFLGDYIDRGPASRGCVDAILDFQSQALARVICLRGNHEEWLDLTRADFTRHSWLLGMDGLDTVRSYSAEAARTLEDAWRAAGLRLYTEKVTLPYEAFFTAMPQPHLEFFSNLLVSVATDDCMCSHAGLDPRLPAAAQTADGLIWGNAAFPADYRGDELVVYGHRNDAVIDEQGWPGPHMRSNTIGIDTISYGVLTAIRLPDRRVFQSGGSLIPYP